MAECSGSNLHRATAPEDKQLEGLDGLLLWQDGDHEKTFLFPVEVFEEVWRS